MEKFDITVYCCQSDDEAMAQAIAASLGGDTAPVGGAPSPASAVSSHST